MGPHPPCSHCAPLSIQPPDFSPILTDNHVALRVCSEVGLMRSPLCWAPRRDSHSAFRRRTPTPPPHSLFLPAPLTHGFITAVTNECSIWTPGYLLFFLCFFNLSSGLFATTQWKKHVCNQTTAQLQITTNNINILLFPPSKKQRRIPTFGCNFSLSHPFKTIPCAKQQHCVNAPLPSSPDSHLCLTAAVIQLQLFVQEKTSNCKKKNLQRVWNWTFQLPHLRKKKTQKTKTVTTLRSIVQLCHWGSAQHKQRAE